MILDPYFYILGIPAVLIVGISKGGFGGGLGLLAVPMMALTISPIQAASIMLPILCIMDLLGIWHFRGKGSWKILSTLLPAAIIGIILGAFTFKYFNENHIKILIGFIALAFCLNYWLKPNNSEAAKPSKIAGYFWGIISGFTSFGVHAGGPPVNAYLLPLKLEKSVFVGTTILFFAVVNYLKIIPYFFLEQFNMQNLTTSALLVIFAPIGVKIGYHLHNKINEIILYRCCYFFLLITGCKLLFDGFKAL